VKDPSKKSASHLELNDCLLILPPALNLVNMKATLYNANKIGKEQYVLGFPWN
jgi:hypothetical protein